MSKAYRQLRRPLETTAFRIALFILPRLPRCVILGLAWFGGMLGFFFDRRGKAIGLANLGIAFGDSKTAREKATILRTAYTTMTRTFLDVIWFGTHPEKRLKKYILIDESMQVMLCHKSQICVTAHFGNWEVAGQIMALKGFPLHSIAMPVKNPEVDRLFIQRREITGQKIIPREGALRRLLGTLRNGGKIAFLVDQNTEAHEGGIWADYFGLPVAVTPAPAVLAARTGSDIFICFCMPISKGRYRIYLTETLPPPEHSNENTTAELTQQILSAIEREVRLHPGYWLWMYKRWKKRNRSVNQERYPFYADRN